MVQENKYRIYCFNVLLVERANCEKLTIQRPFKTDIILANDVQYLPVPGVSFNKHCTLLTKNGHRTSPRL